MRRQAPGRGCRVRERDADHGLDLDFAPALTLAERLEKTLDATAGFVLLSNRNQNARAD
jgi:hypothetical protein